MHRLLCLPILCLVVATSSPASARTEAQKALDKAAKKACLTGDFRKGAEILTQLYIDTGDPTYLFNQGRCYEQNHRWQEAMDAFREYKRKATNLSGAEAADTEKHIADCELFLAKEEAKRSAQSSSLAPPAFANGPDATPGLAWGSAQQPMGPGVAPEVSAAGSPPTRSSSGAGLRTTGLVLGGVGIASLVTGVIFNVKANSLADELNQHYSRSKDSTQSSYQTLSWVGYGLGAAALVSGGVCYFLGVRRRGAMTASNLGVVPVVGREHAGLYVQGAF